MVIRRHLLQVITWVDLPVRSWHLALVSLGQVVLILLTNILQVGLTSSVFGNSPEAEINWKWIVMLHLQEMKLV